MTAIEWAHHAHNVVSGCSPASPGCDICYAAFISDGRLKHQSCALPDGMRGRRADLVLIGKRKDDPSKKRRIYNGKVALDVPRLRKALNLPKNGGKKGPRVFWNHLSDTFHERLSFTEIAAQFASMAARPDLQFLVLTKRPARAKEFFAWLHTWAVERYAVGYGQYLAQTYHELVRWPVTSGRRGHPSYADMFHHAESWPLRNVGLGVSAEDQPRWDARVSVLRELPAAMRFVSVEPMIGPVIGSTEQLADLDQVIIGAESGPGARPMDLRWAQDLAKAVLDARGPALFFKQGDVCSMCGGRAAADSEWCECPAVEYVGTQYPPGSSHAGVDISGTAPRAYSQRRTGTTGKVRKSCPALYVPGHGTKSWAQFPEGWQ